MVLVNRHRARRSWGRRHSGNRLEPPDENRSSVKVCNLCAEIRKRAFLKRSKDPSVEPSSTKTTSILTGIVGANASNSAIKSGKFSSSFKNGIITEISGWSMHFPSSPCDYDIVSYFIIGRICIKTSLYFVFSHLFFPVFPAVRNKSFWEPLTDTVINIQFHVLHKKSEPAPP